MGLTEVGLGSAEWTLADVGWVKYEGDFDSWVDR